MAKLNRIPVLRCAGCNDQIPLPYQIQPNTSEIQPYWPKDEQNLSLVCRNCGHTSVHSAQDIHLEIADTTGQQLPQSLFAVVVFGCAMQNCYLPIRVHIRIEGGLTRQAIIELVLDATPKPICAAGHTLSKESVQEQVQILDWSGKTPYLT